MLCQDFFTFLGFFSSGKEGVLYNISKQIERKLCLNNKKGTKNSFPLGRGKEFFVHFRNKPLIFYNYFLLRRERKARKDRRGRIQSSQSLAFRQRELARDQAGKIQPDPSSVPR